MKFGQFIENNAKNIFPEKLKTRTQKMMEKLFPDPFLKNQNLAFLDQ